MTLRNHSRAHAVGLQEYLGNSCTKVTFNDRSAFRFECTAFNLRSKRMQSSSVKRYWRISVGSFETEFVSKW
jgi:hypothetical protein